MPNPAAESDGDKTTFSTGAQRGSDHEDCFLHMIPPEALYAYGRAFAEGAKKYGENNWLKGLPFSSLVNHAMHHILKFVEGDASEDHLGHCLWNIGALIHFSKHMPELNDLPLRRRSADSSASMQELTPGVDFTPQVTPSAQQWEVIDDVDGVMSRVRWSQPNVKGEYLWAAHYPRDLRHLAESTASHWNKLGRHPSEWQAWREGVND